VIAIRATQTVCHFIAAFITNHFSAFTIEKECVDTIGLYHTPRNADNKPEEIAVEEKERKFRIIIEENDS
jgi:hypothetical protein